MDTVDFMRWVDCYVGVPICLILSVLNKLKAPFAKQKDIIKKILVLQISEMGSTIHAYPSIKYLQKKHPKAEIYYLIFKEMQESIKLLDLVAKNNVITIRGKSVHGFILDTLRAIWILRKEKIDVVIDLELFARFSSILSYLSGAKSKVGFHNFTMEGLYRGNFLTHKVLYNHTLPISVNFMALVQAVERTENEVPMLKAEIDRNRIEIPKIKSTEQEKQSIWKKLKRINTEIERKKAIVILNPNASQLLPLRRWPLQNYAKLAAKLLTHPGIFLVITGIKSEAYDAQTICDAVKNKRCIDFTGQTSLRELIDLYNISDIMISNDSGPPNFASLTGMRTIVLFGPETPVCYAPLGNNITVVYSNFACSPCVSAYNHRKSICKDNKCLQAISVDMVYKEVSKHLNL